MHACICVNNVLATRIDLFPCCQSGDVIFCKLRNYDAERPYVLPPSASETQGAETRRPKSSISSVLKDLDSLPKRRPWRQIKVPQDSIVQDKVASSASMKDDNAQRVRAGNRSFDIEIIDEDCPNASADASDATDAVEFAWTGGICQPQYFSNPDGQSSRPVTRSSTRPPTHAGTRNLSNLHDDPTEVCPCMFSDIRV